MANPFLVLGGIAVGAVVATFGVLQVPGWIAKAQDASAINDLSNLAHAQAAYQASDGLFTAELTDLGGQADASALNLEAPVTTLAMSNKDSVEGKPSFRLSPGVKLTHLGVSDEKDAWCGVVQSPSGRFFASSNNVTVSEGSSTAKGATLLAGCEAGSGGKYQANTIVFRLDTTAAGCASPGVSPNGHRGNVLITWGDGTKSRAVNGMNVHNYAKPGVYDVTVEGTVPSWTGLWFASAKCITDVVEWGETGTTSTMTMFQGASNLRSVAAPPKTVTNMASMFSLATNFDQDLTDWDVSNVERMGSMFQATVFNGDISNWDVSKVWDFSNMFGSTKAFNGDISDWTPVSATTTASMFAGAKAFSGDLSKWRMPKLDNMASMFSDTTTFNTDLSEWNTSSVTRMDSAFSNAKGDFGNIAQWKTGSVTNMNMTFYLSSLTYDLSGWDVRSVTKKNMFADRSKLTGLPKFS